MHCHPCLGPPYQDRTLPSCWLGRCACCGCTSAGPQPCLHPAQHMQRSGVSPKLRQPSRPAECQPYLWHLTFTTPKPGNKYRLTVHDCPQASQQVQAGEHYRVTPQLHIRSWHYIPQAKQYLSRLSPHMGLSHGPPFLLSNLAHPHAAGILLPRLPTTPPCSHPRLCPQPLHGPLSNPSGASPTDAYNIPPQPHPPTQPSRPHLHASPG